MTPEEQYLSSCMRIIRNGTWTSAGHGGYRTKAVINVDMEYDCRVNHIPVLTTKKTAWRPAIAEMLGYLKGYTNAEQFRRLGTSTWDANAATWQDSDFCAGPDDMGYCYGAVGSGFLLPDQAKNLPGRGYYVNEYNDPIFNQWEPVIADLSAGQDNRREIVTFYHPGTMPMACLPPCMHTHTFSLLGGYLHLTSYQRSADMPLGVPFNMIQVAFLLQLVAQITGNKPGFAYHKIVNAHIYENQIDLMQEQMQRIPKAEPLLFIDPLIETWDDVVNHMTLDHVELEHYESHPSIKYLFSV